MLGMFAAKRGRGRAAAIVSRRARIPFQASNYYPQKSSSSLFRTFSSAAGGDSGGGDFLAKKRMPPPPAAASSDPWTEVYDEASGKVYWWNEETDETTELGAPKPQGDTAAYDQGGSLPQQQQGGGLGRVVAEGFSFGVGASIARAAVGSLFGGFGGDEGGGGDGDDDDWV